MMDLFGPQTQETSTTLISLSSLHITWFCVCCNSCCHHHVLSWWKVFFL